MKSNLEKNLLNYITPELLNEDESLIAEKLDEALKELQADVDGYKLFIILMPKICALDLRVRKPTNITEAVQAMVSDMLRKDEITAQECKKLKKGLGISLSRAKGMLDAGGAE